MTTNFLREWNDRSGQLCLQMEMGKVGAKAINQGRFEPLAIAIYESIPSWNLECQNRALDPNRGVERRHWKANRQLGCHSPPPGSRTREEHSTIVIGGSLVYLSAGTCD
jgi:hypothetical protein